ncbi:bacillithiol biosynthesis cysteine-adding enzyme BshC [Neolewinella aurantiaca]|uniref:Putative cysteine ligase BshC n=1 Tax=Neolewinella aurantiaca TaxID=2602767 RepID=A0A5C7FJU2_9BACT|nr:bacillithiol biosynthesis cysteine-adding enzyme BshC [Neolewinella aurantiaca]TXF85686.1 bacillithiol biosynthesis cysteine-adding enzyme BshC [Neolewinella aurantiaca]
MHIDRIPFPDVPQFSQRDVAYATGAENLKPFFKYPVSLEAFEDVMADKAKDNTDRKLLVDELLAQYESFKNADAARTQVQSLLDENTFTVITAHQPSLFTGPLYFIYKICSTINLSRQLNERYPDKHIVPLFIMGGEDHDFDEINHARIKGEMIRWEQEVGGSVAMLSTTSLAPALSALKELLGGEFTPFGIHDRIQRAYTKHKTYGEATVAFVHDLFKDTELVVANPSRKAFKEAFRPMMEREIFEQLSQPLIEKAQSELTAAGYSGQAHAREINLFYLSPGRRDRIVFQGGVYGVLDTDKVFSEAEFREELASYPERFSPNVVMRPLFQELIFPNLAYIGGGGELAYWLERKEQFSAFGLNFPMLIRRNSVVWVDAKSGKKMDKLGLSVRDLLRHDDLIIRDFVAKHTKNELSLADELAQLKGLFETMSLKAKAIDPTLEAAALAEGTRQRKIVEQFESRLRRVEKTKFDREMTTIRELRATLFPGNSLQERKDNFLNVYLESGEEMFPVLLEALDPLTPGMVVVKA